ncbi:hypothetical protein D3C87_1276900 [compost metagenome]|jgi:hypothetical protein|nr:hypothetical protein CBM2604_U10047 [Cupriavidus taiwanensis]SOZ34450.1 hypothetical protein CBM2609_U10046 [Cupriavidus taiwanensis]SOZ53037.1 hypothetical protein CBM2610_U10046 [Cupriavidus taiwanensis]
MCRKREVTPPEEFNTEVRFKLADSMTHGAGCYTQLVGGTCGAPKPCNRLEGDKTLNGRDVLQGHIFSPFGGLPRADMPHVIA